MMSQADPVTSERLRGLLDAVVAMSRELTLDAVLDHVVRTACTVVGAEHGFLGVLETRPERRFGTFVVHGLDHRQVQQALLLPSGGMLADLLDPPGPLRVDDIRTRHDRDRFPALHADMTSFLGVPIVIHDQVFGHLYLTDRIGAPTFTAEDEQALVALAAAAAVVVENARLYEQTEHQRRWLAGRAEMTTALLEPVTRLGMMRMVVDKVREVSDAEVAVMLMPDDDGRQRVRAVSGLDARIVGSVPTLPDGVAMVPEDREPVVVDRFDDELDPWGADWPRLTTYLAVAISAIDGTGLLLIGWTAGRRVPTTSLDPAFLQAFAQQASLGMQVARAQDDQARLAVYEDRDRIGRDLHDLVIQRLFAVGLSLEGMMREVLTDQARTRLDQAVDDLDNTIKDIRRTIFDLGRTVASTGLRQDLEQIVDEASPLLGFLPEMRISGRLETVPDAVGVNLLHVVREQLSNIVRHAGARHVTIQLDCTRQVELTIRDDGHGKQGESVGNGLQNMQHRARQLGGACRIDSQPGRGFEIRWAVPKEQP